METNLTYSRLLGTRQNRNLKGESHAQICQTAGNAGIERARCRVVSPEAYLDEKTEYGWYLCLDDDQIVGGTGVIENDFHDRKDLFPNVCAVYTEESYRKKGIAGNLLNLTVDDLRSKGITPVYLVTDHTGFYERYGWEFLCMVQGDDEPDMTRMYIHRFCEQAAVGGQVSAYWRRYELVVSFPRATSRPSVY